MVEAIYCSDNKEIPHLYTLLYTATKQRSHIKGEVCVGGNVCLLLTFQIRRYIQQHVWMASGETGAENKCESGKKTKQKHSVL